MNMERPKFNPGNEKYKKVADLPEKERDNYKDVEGGFVEFEAARGYRDAEITAQVLQESYGMDVTTQDVLHERADSVEKHGSDASKGRKKF